MKKLLSFFKIGANALCIAVRFWNYGKQNCLAFITFYKKQITKLFSQPKWRQCAVGSSFSQGSVPQDRNKEKLSCLEIKQELSRKNISFEQIDNCLIINASIGINGKELLEDLSSMGVTVEADMSDFVRWCKSFKHLVVQHNIVPQMEQSLPSQKGVIQ